MDKLKAMYDAWVAKQTPGEEWTDYQTFQAGFTASAVSMRERAIAVIRATVKTPDELNAAINAVGSLPDIPTE